MRESPCASVLEKKGGLNHKEFELVKMHPVTGSEMLGNLESLSHVSLIVKHHHERYDGNGYPDGLCGDEIPFLSRILHVADAFDSMTADRPYRKAPGRRYAISELVNGSGRQFDPDVVEAFLDIAGAIPLY